MIITIDGSAGCGKSTLAKNLSKKYNCQFVSTGNIYRAVALMAIENKIKYYDEPELKKLVEKLNIRIFDGKIFVNGKNLTHFLHTRKVDGLVHCMRVHKL